MSLLNTATIQMGLIKGYNHTHILQIESAKLKVSCIIYPLRSTNGTLTTTPSVPKMRK